MPEQFFYVDNPEIENESPYPEPDPATNYLNLGTNEFWSADQSGPNFYGYYRVETKYRTCPGIMALPTNGDNTVFVRLHSPYNAKVVKFSAERFGDWPDLPSTDVENDNEVLVDSDVTLHNPHLSNNDVYVYRANGYYTYRMALPISDTSPLATATTPAEIQAPLQHALPPSVFTTAIISAAGLDLP